MTKMHEEFVERPISEILSTLSRPVGEYTVALEIGEKTENEVAEPPRASHIAAEFGRLSENGRLGRRAIVATLAKRHGLSNKDVYRAIEEAKKYGK
jgi:16S rRNA C1402 (ribose-2'-O) methylase RsmI